MATYPDTAGTEPNTAGTWPNQIGTFPNLDGTWPGGVDPNAEAFIAAMVTPPTAARAALIETYFVALKTAGIYSKFDTLYLLAAADAQAASLNLVAPANFTLALIGAVAARPSRRIAAIPATAHRRHSRPSSRHRRKG
jgi:hypothetical protein